MWLFLWVIFVLCAIGFFLWSYYETFEQKKAWKAYASKMGLAYAGGAMLQSPEMTGEIKGHKLNFYPQMVEDAVGQNTTQNVVEVFLNYVPDAAFVVTSPEFSLFVSALGLDAEFTVDDVDWPKNIVTRTLEGEQADFWFKADRQRIAVMNSFMKLPFATAFIVDGEQAFLAIRTVNPLSDPRKLNQLVNKLISLAEALDMSQKEQAQEKPEAPKATAAPEDQEQK